jgi:hypothetical protein
VPKPYGISPHTSKAVYRKAVNMEVWKDVVGFEGKYQVSNLGNVKSMDYGRTKQERLLKPATTDYGYLRCGLRKDGHTKMMHTHRLVAEAFIPNPDNKRDVNHINGVKTDNRVENLEWCTEQENNVHALKMGIRKPYTIKLLQYDMQGAIIREWNSSAEAERSTGISQGNIRNCCHGKRPSAGGYIWRYKEA